MRPLHFVDQAWESLLDEMPGNPLLANAYYEEYKYKAVPKNEAPIASLVIWASEWSPERSRGHMGVYTGGDNFVSRGANVETPGSIGHTSSLFGGHAPIYVPIYFDAPPNIPARSPYGWTWP